MDGSALPSGLRPGYAGPHSWPLCKPHQTRHVFASCRIHDSRTAPGHALGPAKMQALRASAPCQSHATLNAVLRGSLHKKEETGTSFNSLPNRCSSGIVPRWQAPFMELAVVERSWQRSLGPALRRLMGGSDFSRQLRKNRALGLPTYL